MNIHEFGTENEKVVILIHPSIVMWDYFEYVIPLMEREFHLVIPALPGYDPDTENDYTSVEEIACDLAKWLETKNISEIECIYGCSMGGSVVILMLSENKVTLRHPVIDGGITPYQLPWIVTRFIALKDFLMISMGKIGGIKLLEKAFSTDEYSDEDLKYAARVMKMISFRTIWRTFDSCNNYKLLRPIVFHCESVEYWFADAEEKARKQDIAFLRKFVHGITFRRINGVGHGGLAPLYPEKLVKGLKHCMKPTG